MSRRERSSGLSCDGVAFRLPDFGIAFPQRGKPGVLISTQSCVGSAGDESARFAFPHSGLMQSFSFPIGVHRQFSALAAAMKAAQDSLTTSRAQRVQACR